MIQLRGVALWNRDGERRTIELRPGQLNVITGEAKTGKSALLEIVEFCLGRSTVSLPEGALTRAVEWYGLLVGTGSESVFIGRPGPSEGQASVSGAYLALGGAGLGFPDHGELQSNANADAVTEHLTRLVGIGEYGHIPPTWAMRPPLRPKVRHASLYCFQRQNEIANPRQLFHRQDEDYMPQAIKDTLPYFLGAADREAPLCAIACTRCGASTAGPRDGLARCPADGFSHPSDGSVYRRTGEVLGDLVEVVMHRVHGLVHDVELPGQPLKVSAQLAHVGVEGAHPLLDVLELGPEPGHRLLELGHALGQARRRLAYRRHIFAQRTHIGRQGIGGLVQRDEATGELLSYAPEILHYSVQGIERALGKPQGIEERVEHHRASRGSGPAMRSPESTSAPGNRP